MGDGVTTPSDRTDDQTEIALFWVESSPLAVEPDRQDRLRRIRASTCGRTRACSACSTWPWPTATSARSRPSTLYNYWRPVTAIQTADTDGNPNTDADPTWTPLVPTPPIPDHDSAHSVEGGAAAQVLRRFFGTDQISFETCSLTLPAGQHVHRRGRR